MNEGFRRLDPATAQGHLTHRYATGSERGAWESGRPMEPVDVLGQLCRAERGELDDRWHNGWQLPVARRVDVAAGLSLLSAIRDELDRQELLLILGARVRSASWQQVADVLGLESRQAAEQRCRRLRERWPDVAAPATLPLGADDAGDVLVPPPGHLRVDSLSAKG